MNQKGGAKGMRLNVAKVAAVLKERDMRQKDLVHRTGISRNTISAVCNRKSCSEDTARKIAEALDVTMDELVEAK